MARSLPDGMNQRWPADAIAKHVEKAVREKNIDLVRPRAAARGTKPGATLTGGQRTQRARAGGRWRRRSSSRLTSRA